MNSSFFEPKSRKRYGCEMPARRAIASVDAPWMTAKRELDVSPPRATATRRSSAVCLVVVVCAMA